MAHSGAAEQIARVLTRNQLSSLAFLLALVACDQPGADSGRAEFDSVGPAPQAKAAADSAPEAGAVTHQGRETVTSSSNTPADSAVAVLRAFYDAINARDYPRAYAAWGEAGPPGHPTEAQFARGYAATDSVRLAIGTPGPLGAAAGSRYITVPVSMRAFEHGGTGTAYRGSYTLRRTAVPGASVASQHWHLYAAALDRVR